MRAGRGTAPATISGMTNIEKDTNQALRKKYFADSKQIIQTHKGIRKKSVATSKIISASKVSVKGTRTLLRPGTAPEDHIIKVQVIRDNDVVKSIRIKCPCGRSAELNCEYSPEI